MHMTATASPCLKSGVISVFITNLGKYNEGKLVGEWIECSAQLNQDTFLKEFCSYSIGDRSPLAV
ncbi:hypothetical protein M2263_001331 [Providencia alcalifaciens]|nr:hypothetical protein [Providencia alcalifaciens]